MVSQNRISVNRTVPYEIEGRSLGLPEQGFELLSVVERADQCQVEPVTADHGLSDALDVLRGDGVEPFLNRLWIDSLAFEHLAAEAEHDHPLRVLELKQEPSLGKVARLLELGGLDRLVDDPLQL